MPQNRELWRVASVAGADTHWPWLVLADRLDYAADLNASRGQRQIATIRRDLAAYCRRQADRARNPIPPTTEG